MGAASVVVVYAQALRPILPLAGRRDPALVDAPVTALRDGHRNFSVLSIALQLPTITEEPGTGEAFVLSRTADDSKVRIYLETVPSRIPAEGALTRVSIRVGAFGDEAVSARILDQVSRHLGPPPLVAPAAGAPPPPLLGPIRPVAATRPPETEPPPLAPPGPVPAPVQ